MDSGHKSYFKILLVVIVYCKFTISVLLVYFHSIL